VYSEVCLKYLVRENLLCTELCVSGTGTGNIIVYNDVCVKYSGRGMFFVQ